MFSFFQDNKIIIYPKEILFVTAISIPLGFIISLFINKTWLHNFSWKIRVSNRFGETDVFKHMMNVIKPDPGWVVIRDIKNDLMYIGWIYAYSTVRDKIELFLRDVTIYKNSTGEEIFETPGLYFQKVSEDCIIEFKDLISEIEHER